MNLTRDHGTGRAFTRNCLNDRGRNNFTTLFEILESDTFSYSIIYPVSKIGLFDIKCKNYRGERVIIYFYFFIFTLIYFIRVIAVPLVIIKGFY